MCAWPSFIMVMSQPHFTQILELPVFTDFPGLQMAVVIHNGKPLPIAVVQPASVGFVRRNSSENNQNPIRAPPSTGRQVLICIRPRHCLKIRQPYLYLSRFPPSAWESVPGFSQTDLVPVRGLMEHGRINPSRRNGVDAHPVRTAFCCRYAPGPDNLPWPWHSLPPAAGRCSWSCWPGNDASALLLLHVRHNGLGERERAHQMHV